MKVYVVLNERTGDTAEPGWTDVYGIYATREAAEAARETNQQKIWGYLREPEECELQE